MQMGMFTLRTKSPCILSRHVFQLAMPSTTQCKCDDDAGKDIDISRYADAQQMSDTLTMRVDAGRQAIAAEMGSLAASLQALAAPASSAVSQPYKEPAPASPANDATELPTSGSGA